MLADLLLINRMGPQPLARKGWGMGLSSGLSEAGSHRLKASADDEVFILRTCLRQVVLAPLEVLEEIELQPEDTVLQGYEAYRFCLEIACGLHSPLVGETEVYGQLRNAAANFDYPATPFGSLLKRFFKMVFEDAKKVRQAHLQNLGSQSYGSVVRRELEGEAEIHILGAGQLVAEMLPWIVKDGAQVHVHCRQPGKAQELLEKYPALKIHSLESGAIYQAEGSLLLAAPVSSLWLTEWIGPKSERFSRVIDLRGEAEADGFKVRTPLISLQGLFARIKEQEQILAVRKNEALAAIRSLMAERARHIEYRPFGWDDVCA